MVDPFTDFFRHAQNIGQEEIKEITDRPSGNAVNQGQPVIQAQEKSGISGQGQAEEGEYAPPAIIISAYAEGQQESPEGDGSQNPEPSERRFSPSDKGKQDEGADNKPLNGYQLRQLYLFQADVMEYRGIREGISAGQQKGRDSRDNIPEKAEFFPYSLPEFQRIRLTADVWNVVHIFSAPGLPV